MQFTILAERATERETAAVANESEAGKSFAALQALGSTPGGRRQDGRTVGQDQLTCGYDGILDG